MASFHHNFAVFEITDPLDSVLYDTVADLKNPPRVPHQAAPQHWHERDRMKLRSKPYPLTSTEGFGNE